MFRISGTTPSHLTNNAATADIKVKLTNCDFASLIPPSLPDPTLGGDFISFVTDGVETITIATQFDIGSIHCPLISMQIVSVLAGSSSDFTSTDGVSQVSLLTIPSDANIQIQIPFIDELIRDFIFRV